MTTIPAEKLDKLVSRWQAIQGEPPGADAESYAQLKGILRSRSIVGTINALRQAQGEYDGLQEISMTAAPTPT